MQLPSIELRRLFPHPNNPRGNLGDLTELAESIKVRGIQQNLTVVPSDLETYERNIKGKKAYRGDYTVVIGHRRTAAARLAGLTEIPCLIITDMDLKDQIAVMLAENMHRKELTLLEEAQGMQLMLDLGDSVKDVSTKTGLSKSTVYGRLKIVKTFGKDAIERVQDRPIELGDYEKMYEIENPEKRAEVFEQVGTKEFDWALNSAINAQKKEKQKLQLIGIISKFATETSPEVYRSSTKSHYFNYYRYDTHDLEAVQSLAAEVKKSGGEYAEIKLFYTVEHGFSGITVYAVANESDLDTKKAATQAEKDRKEAYKARIKSMFKQAYEMRFAFAKKFNVTSDTSETVKRMAAFALLSQKHADEETIRALFGIDKKFRQSWEKGEDETREEALSRIIGKHCNVQNLDTFVFKGAYIRIEPGSVNCIDNSGKYEFNESLDMIYSFLTNLGYVMSEEENKLIAGTHPVYNEAP